MSKFIAAMDNSGGSTGGVLDRYELAYTEEDKFDKIHDMRMRMINSPDFNSDNIWAAILYKDTVERGVVDVLNKKGINTFLKIDSGCADNGTMKQFPVKQMLEYANKHNMYGTKMRSIVKYTTDVNKVLDQQFTIASSIAAVGLIPIVEPEVSIHNPNKEAIEDVLMHQLREFLMNFKGKCILKLTPPEVPNLYHSLTLLSNVEHVVFLSGGYSTTEACNRLGLNDNVTASFSRALAEGLTYNLTNKEFNAKLSNNIKLIKEA